MSTKTIALDSRVYDKLAAAKRQGESFSKLIERLLAEIGAAHTGRDILNSLKEIPPLAERDAEIMLAVVGDNRMSEDWRQHDLR